MKTLPNRLTADPGDRGIQEKPSLGVWVRYNITRCGTAFTMEPKPRFLFRDPEGDPPAGWASPRSPEDERLRTEAQAKVTKPDAVAARRVPPPAVRRPPRPAPRPRQRVSGLSGSRHAA